MEVCNGRAFLAYKKDRCGLVIDRVVMDSSRTVYGKLVFENKKYLDNFLLEVLDTRFDDGLSVYWVNEDGDCGLVFKVRELIVDNGSSNVVRFIGENIWGGSLIDYNLMLESCRG